MSVRRRFVFTLLTVLLVVSLVEGLCWAALSVLSGKLMTYERLYQAGLQVVTSNSSAGQRSANLGAAPDLVSRDVVHPFLGFVLDRRFQNTLRRQQGGADAVEYGFALSEPGIFHPAAADQYVVAVTGGSVAFNLAGQYGSLLRDTLALRLRPAADRVVVVDLALPGYKQPQQLMTLAYFLTLGAHFDLIVNLDGYNEVALAPMENRPKGVFPFFPRSWYWRVMDLEPDQRVRLGELAYVARRRVNYALHFAPWPVRHSMTAGLVWYVGDRLLARQANRLQWEMTNAAAAPSSYLATGPARSYASDEEMYADLADMWERSSLQMHRLARSNGIPYVHLLQPNQYLPGSKPIGDAERQLAYLADYPGRKHVENGYPLLIAAGSRLQAQGVDFHDLTQLFADVSEPLYEDTCCHLNEKGNQLLAEAVAVAAQPPPHDGPAAPPGLSNAGSNIGP